MPSFLFTLFFLMLSISQLAFAARRLTESPPLDSSTLLHYHHGPLLSGDISVNLIWYGHFTPPQKAIVTDFIASLSTTTPTHPSVATWWRTTDHYFPNSRKPTLRVGIQVSDPDCSLGKSLTEKELVKLAAKGQHSHAVNVVLTASDVSVDGFCSSRCGTHRSHISGSHVKRSHTSGHISSDTFSKSVHKRQKFAYIWVGNSDTQCPGQCAWPFHQPVYGPQTEPLVAPNNDVGVDGMVINLASLLAGTATNPFGNGYYQGDAGAALEAASACPGVYGKGAYPGYAGNLLVDPSTGASYNAYGANGRKYLLPALFDPSTSSCSTLV